MMTTSFPVTCPQCGYRIMKTLGELEAVDDFRCPDCGLLIKVEGLRETLHRVPSGYRQTQAEHSTRVPQEVIQGIPVVRSHRTRRTLTSSLRYSRRGIYQRGPSMAQDTTAVDEQWETFRPQTWRKGAHKGERKMLYGIRDPGETMECLIGGAFGPDMEKAKFGKTFHSAIGVATDRRVIFVDKGLFGSTEVREMPYTSVDAITYSTRNVPCGTAHHRTRNNGRAHGDDQKKRNQAVCRLCSLSSVASRRI
jgi:predicted RNA-binding Zn-ribbon protein involved in translation (DUF1610 family)